MLGNLSFDINVDLSLACDLEINCNITFLTALPLFTIITPLFNKASYFQETVNSVLGQSCDDWQWLIIDDGSTDGSLELARLVEMADIRIQVFTQTNSGPCSARNRGIVAAKGEWMLFLDADDLLESSSLADWVAAISQAPSARLHAAAWHEIAPEGGEVTCTHRPPGCNYSSATAILLESAIAYAPWHPAAAIVKREVVCGDRMWDEAMNRLVTEDTVFWWRLLTHCHVAVHSHCGVRYRRGTPGCRDQFRDTAKWSQGLFYALQSNINYWTDLGHELSGGQVANLVRVYAAFGREAEISKDSGNAREAYYRADALLATKRWKGCAATLRRLLGSRRFEQLRAAW